MLANPATSGSEKRERENEAKEMERGRITRKEGRDRVRKGWDERYR